MDSYIVKSTFLSCLIFDEKFDGVVEIPNFKFFRIYKNKVWIQPLST